MRLKPRVYLFFLLLFLLLVSCNALNRKSVAGLSIAYVDMKSLYLYSIAHDPDFVTYRDNEALRDLSDNNLSPYLLDIKKSVLVKIDDAIRYIADQNGITVVLAKDSSLVYAENSLDITQSVINELKLRNNRRAIHTR
ncbi:MAG: OmpH family outer membrane protein [Spirochaetes bacterium]|jgi:Skp family chaperone for outer membrane proteins|nr:OmpH family outer membrane protein [Spirochaetota bacterium]